MTIILWIVLIPFVLLVLALILQPIAQKRREQAIWEQMKNARDAKEAGAMADAAVKAAHPESKLPEHWNDSYRFWDK